MQLQPTQLSLRVLHTIHLPSTPLFPAPVGLVGNPVSQTGLRACFSKSPEFHTLVLENPPTPQPTAGKPLRSDSHFSLPPTETTALYLRKTHTTEAPLARAVPLCRACFANTPRIESRHAVFPSNGSSPSRRANHPRNPENNPCFPRPRKQRDAYNQEEQTQPFPLTVPLV